ncbi:hypothetical protein [Scytonema sp. PCC 10023]|uniref:hypothetical protein n=1 Tax=Scytonema sp. PCC 10023 TaxID=1680591 RepID=UPI0039C5C09B
MSRAEAQRRASAAGGFPDSQATGVAKKYTKKTNERNKPIVASRFYLALDMTANVLDFLSIRLQAGG